MSCQRTTAAARQAESLLPTSYFAFLWLP